MGAATRSGRHWVVTAVGMAASPLLLWLASHLIGVHKECLRIHGAASNQTVDGVAGPCVSGELAAGATVVAFYAVVLVGTLVGVVVGVVEGRQRRRFAHGRWISAVAVGLCAPWALLAYGLGYGLGRLLPAPRPPEPPRSDPALERGWETAQQLYARLSSGQAPPVVTSGFLIDETVHMDVPFLYARYYGMNVTYGQTSTLAVGSPLFVAGAMVGNAIGNASARSQAARLAASQWREHCHPRVVVTSTATWCCVNGKWLRFDHAAVVEYSLDGAACILSFTDAEPLRLTGPSAWCHAILFAYLQNGPDRWPDALFLHPIREAARQINTGQASPQSDKTPYG